MHAISEAKFQRIWNSLLIVITTFFQFVAATAPPVIIQRIPTAKASLTKRTPSAPSTTAISLAAAAAAAVCFTLLSDGIKSAPYVAHTFTSSTHTQLQAA
jgi:hypothetical protein